MAFDISLEELLQYMDPDVVDQIVNSGLAQQRGALAQQQMVLGREMANAPSAQGRTVRNGIYVAASPVEHLASAIRQYQGIKKMRGAAEEQEEQIRAQGRGTRNLLDTLRTYSQPDPNVPATNMPELDLTKF